MTVPRPPQPRRRRRSGFRFLFTFTATTVMIATGGFGAFPDNPISQTFQTVISENFTADFLNPFNSYMEYISAPTIQPRPDSKPAFDPIGLLINAVAANASAIPTEEIANIEPTILTETQTPFLTSTPVFTLTTPPTLTAIPTASATIVPTWTFPPFIIYPTKTRQPPPPDTPTNTPTATATPRPGGFSLNTITLNGNSDTVIYVWPGASFEISYNYQVWSSDNCPTCIIQLVTGLGSAGVGTTTCGYDNIPGVTPGAAGTAVQTLTAPLTAGVYDIIVEYTAQYDCPSALAAYGSASNVAPQTIGQIVVNADVINVYTSNLADGALGGRAGADAVCLASKPPQFANPNVRALISIADTDSISTLPSLYNVPTNIPLVYENSRLMAKNWADLVDGGVNASLVAGGFSSNFWWSGAEDEFGNAIPATANCNGFTSSLATAYGNAGNAATNGAGWMNIGPQACNNTYALVCIASP